MLKKLQYVLLGFGIAISLDWAWAQTPTIFNNIRVNQQTDLRGDVLNGTGTLTLADTVSVTGKLTTAASALGGAGLNLPAGTAPSSPVNGDVWTTTSGLFAQINGGTVGPFSAGGSAAGSNGQLQFNDMGAFGADATLTFDTVTKQLSIQNLIVAQAAGAYITLNDTTGVVDSRKVSWYEDPVAMNGKGGFCLLTDAQTDPIAECAGTPTRNFLSWVHTGSTIGSTTLFGGDDLELQATGNSISVTSTGIGLASSGEIDLVAGTIVKAFSPITTLATSTSAAGLNLPHGTAPTSPVDGDLWTTTTGLFTRINGSTVGPLGASAPGGSNTQVQFNDSSAFGGDAGLTYAKATDKLTVAGAVIAGVGTVNDASFQFSGDANTGMFNLGADHLGLTAGGFSYVDINGPSSRVDLIANTSSSQIRLQAPSTVTIWAATLNGGASGNISMTPESGTFTATIDNACTTSPTVDFDYQKIGNLVLLSIVGKSGFPCTGDSTSFAASSTAPVPSSIRPSADTYTAILGQSFIDNGANTTAAILITTGGNIGFNQCAISTTYQCSVNWTASGNRDVPNGKSDASYMLGNP